MISSIDPAPSVISCGGQSALFLSACPQGFQKIFQPGAKGPKKIAALLRQPATPPAWFGTPAIPCLPRPRRQLHCACVWPYGMPVIRPHRRFFHPRTDSPAKVFGREGRGEREPFSKKVSLLASCSLFTSSIVCLPSPKQKNPRWTGDKKRPPRAVSCKGVSNNLWQRPTFPHDVMQYHRRWRA